MAQRSHTFWHAVYRLALGLAVTTSGVIAFGISAGYAEPTWAVVTSTGELLRGHNVVSATRIITGQYEVAFSRNLENCSWVATLGVGTFGGIEAAGLITTAGRSGNVKAIFVRTFDISGLTSDRSFHLKVHC